MSRSKRGSRCRASPSSPADSARPPPRRPATGPRLHRPPTGPPPPPSLKATHASPSAPPPVQEEAGTRSTGPGPALLALPQVDPVVDAGRAPLRQLPGQEALEGGVHAAQQMPPWSGHPSPVGMGKAGWGTLELALLVGGGPGQVPGVGGLEGEAALLVQPLPGLRALRPAQGRRRVDGELPKESARGGDWAAGADLADAEAKLGEGRVAPAAQYDVAPVEHALAGPLQLQALVSSSNSRLESSLTFEQSDFESTSKIPNRLPHS